MARILAIDYGTKKTGIAVTDPLQIVASGLCTVPTYQLFEFLEKYCSTETVEKFVVGYPIGFDERITPHQARVDEFIAKLEEKHPAIPVFREDESYTSKKAREVLWQTGIGKKKRRENKGLVDTMSAALILQSYLGNI